MRALVAIIAFVGAMSIFYFQTDSSWLFAVYFSALIGLIASTALTPSGHQAARRIWKNFFRGWGTGNSPQTSAEG
ncbi:MAG: hypothetical protein SPJ78_10255 [Corynebacterium camporealensis]|uniref:hypothetical protein n=1 Tax=Corynebacterium camporealensis TaxID=161896 RepID=UPI002A913178|nr:hypothetical protein [Corynebacterium camporealensis]MDY5841075.1 hypothetical protein [Corynebacterium camporealensis]